MTRVVVPVAILQGESVPLGLMRLLGTMDVTVLGYHVLPEQTPPDQARLQYEDRANEALADVAEEFREAGGEADYRLVFTQDRNQTVTRVTEEVDAEAFAITGATGDIERLLVPLSGDVATARIVDFVAELIGDREIAVTLLVVSEDEAAGEERLARGETALAEHGVAVETRLVPGGPPIEAVVDAAAAHDVIVMGEQAPTLTSFLFGELPERVAAESVGPVLVVRWRGDAEE